MVRFSDMLGGSGEPDDAAADSPYAALANDDADSDDDAEPEADEVTDAATEPVPVATFETPEAVLDRLTQYRTSTRAADPVAPPVSSETEAPAAVEEPTEVDAPAETHTEPDVESESEPLPPVGDDFLPNARGIVRRAGRGRKRHP
jgi:hypothetical protein